MVHVPPIAHPRDPLHGITLETIVTTLVERLGWAELGGHTNRQLRQRLFASFRGKVEAPHKAGLLFNA